MTDTTAIIDVVRRYWGFDELRPLQEEAIRSGIEHRDSLVVLPTGGGKSLCYQVPPVVAGRTDIIVSPLISLMKDQVDGLKACGYPAAALHSGMTPEERREAERTINSSEARLVFVAPERLLTPYFLNLIERLKVRAFAIDEAHCISHWGHDFRPEYRQLSALKERFPDCSVHACTATATQRVREDIVKQLHLKNPMVLVGVFDRPNLTYRVIPRRDEFSQVEEILRRHAGEAVIIYCISRKDTELMALYLQQSGFNAKPYHAGMEPDIRRTTQDEFSEEKLNIVVATVAFGMGIDRSNVRSVIHAAMPKSIEHYQQETGRAGRDGLEAECVLLYSDLDVRRWKSLINKSAKEAEFPEEVIQANSQLLDEMHRYCIANRCRHRSLSEYFGQPYPNPQCGACDICLEEREVIEDGTIIAQKILSCVARVDQRFGMGYVADVLIGADTEPIQRHGHEKLSTFGLMRDMNRKRLLSIIRQLLDLGVLYRTDDEYPVLKLGPDAWPVLRGQKKINLFEAPARRVKKSSVERKFWEGVDEGLFQSLRDLRREIAEGLGLPPYVVFSDATLREMAAVRPKSLESFINIRGVGRKKQREWGEVFVTHIKDYCSQFNLECDAVSGSRPRSAGDGKGLSPRSLAEDMAFALFARGASIDDVVQATGRSPVTVGEYLGNYIEREKPDCIHNWVDEATYNRVAEAVREVGDERMKPVFEKLKGKISYDQIRPVMRHLKVKVRKRD